MNQHTTCPDCGVPPGGVHADGCDVERCSRCGGQRVSYGCRRPAGRRLAWSGEWPGDAKCREWGWYDADGQPDVNRLVAEAAWDPRAGRYVRRPGPPSPAGERR
jgi:hypothetical protein